MLTRWALANPCPSMIEPVVQSLQKGRPFVVRVFKPDASQGSCNHYLGEMTGCWSIVVYGQVRNVSAMIYAWREQTYKQ
jgi:hypothetical protein